MDTNQEPGIYLVGVWLLESHVADLKPENEREFHLGLTNLQRSLNQQETNESQEEDELIIQASFDLFMNVDAPPITFTCDFMAVYGREKDAEMEWNELSDPLIMAHMIPYVREFVSNITWRLPLPRLVFPPTNTYNLVNEYRSNLNTSESG